MIGYVTIGTKDLDKACAFYDQLLAIVGAKQLMGMDRIKFYGTGPGTPMLAVCTPYDGKPQSAGNGNMVAIPGGSRDGVDKLYAKAMALGATRRGRSGRADADLLRRLRPRPGRQQALLLRHEVARVTINGRRTRAHRR